MIRTVFTALVGLTLAVIGVGWAVSYDAAAQRDVVQADDVTTPGPPPVALPTPTPTPARPPAPPASSDAAEAPLWGTATYVVREGDTLWTVALEMGVDLDVMPCVIDPLFRTNEPLVIGEELVSPAGELVCHQTVAGDTLSSIGQHYGVSAHRILADLWNRFDADTELTAPLEIGRNVRIVLQKEAGNAPGFFAYMLERPIEVPPMLALARGGPVREQSGVLVPENWPYGSGNFEWPSSGWITQAYRHDHRAIDIAAPTGTLVTAADRGVVIRSGWNNQGYGMFVIIDHNIDYVSLYSHLDEIFVAEGDVVGKGEALGTVGSTGNSTGPHLHFEVRDFGSRINPLEVLVR